MTNTGNMKFNSVIERRIYMDKKRTISAMLEIIIGIMLMAGSILGFLDEFWSGMGAALSIVGILFMVKVIRYQTNRDYREKCEIEECDERNRYLSMKAWAWSGYLFVIVSGVGTLVLKILSKEELMMMTSGSICMIMIFYWISYIILKRKY